MAKSDPAKSPSRAKPGSISLMPSGRPAEQHKLIVRQFLDEGLNAGAIAKVSHLLAPDVTVELLGLGTTLQGLEQFLTVARSWSEAIPDLHLDIRSLIAEGDRVALHGHCRGTMRRAWAGYSGGDQAIDYDVMTVFRVQDDRIRAITVLDDVAGLSRQLKAKGSRR